MGIVLRHKGSRMSANNHIYGVLIEKREKVNSAKCEKYCTVARHLATVSLHDFIDSFGPLDTYRKAYHNFPSPAKRGLRFANHSQEPDPWLPTLGGLHGRASSLDLKASEGYRPG